MIPPIRTGAVGGVTAVGYDEAIAYLESCMRGRGEAPGDRVAAGEARMQAMRDLMAALGDPQAAFPAVHVGGTSGKGSTSVLLAAALQACGYRTGLHTTPYLQHATEKLVVNGAPIAPEGLAALVADLRAALADKPGLDRRASFVQRWTALVFMYFARQGVDLGVVEVSLGGRYDATNVVRPVVSVITNVGHDHLEALGPTIADVAWHKAGILKPGVPAVTAADLPEAVAVVEREAAVAAAPLWRVGRDVQVEGVRCDAAGTHLHVHTPARTWADVHLQLVGPHQAVNAATALAALDLLADQGFAVAPEAVLRALATATVPGRFELVQRDPLVVLDGAHNPEKAASLAAALRAAYPRQRVTFVLAVGASKQLPHILDPLLPLAASVVCTEASVTGKPAVPAHRLADAVRGRGVAAGAEPDTAAAVEAALALAGSEGLVCVTGSLYLVGMVRGRWRPGVDLVPAGAT